MLLAVLLLAAPMMACAGAMRISSPDFSESGMIPAMFTCKGDNVSPGLEISGVPAAAKTLALVVEDPDAPSGTFTHWIVWNIAPGTKKVAGGAAPTGAAEGTNDFGNAGYSGPCPPSGTHRYIFRLSALDIAPRLKPGASRKDFDAAIQGHVIARAALMGRFSKD
jgi:Raf kinase inhibitor-like YbhB/YbcL family protein